MVACPECRTISSYSAWYTTPSRSDITDVINLLEQEFNIDRSHIHVTGTSMGGSGTLQYAMFNPQIIASACPVMGVTNFTEFYNWTPDSTLKNSIKTAFGGTPSQVPLVYKDESPLGNEIRFMHTPVFLLHGSADTVVPVSNSRNLNTSLAKAGYDVNYVEVPGVGHYGTDLIGGREQMIYEWFRDHSLAANSSLYLKTGWNMVSFPVIPSNTTFASIFTSVGNYQVLTWSGTSYLAPTNAEAGRGYWVMVLSETIVNVTGVSVESYERDLPAGWSMIGSIYNATVNGDIVFPPPTFYQLLTWNGFSYVDAKSVGIEPGKGYWALVLTPTHITVG
jgi:dienelactone hydrolase